LFITGILLVAAKSGGVGNFFDNYFVTDNIKKRIVCYADNYSFEFRQAVVAKAIKDVFNYSTCELYDKSKKEKTDSFVSFIEGG
jgi:hypothetical protein